MSYAVRPRGVLSALRIATVIGLGSYPYWLMIAGAILITMGVLGVIFARNKQAAIDPETPGASGTKPI